MRPNTLVNRTRNGTPPPGTISYLPGVAIPLRAGHHERLAAQKPPFSIQRLEHP